MTWRDALSMAIKGSSRRLWRTALTILGVMLATALLVSLSTLVDSANSRILNRVGEGGPVTAIEVVAAEPAPGQLKSDSVRRARPRSISDDDREQISELPGVEATFGILTAPITVVPPSVPGAPPWLQGSAVGVDIDEASENLPVSVLRGRLPSEASLAEAAVTQDYLDQLELDAGRPAHVLGSTIDVATSLAHRRIDGELDHFERWVSLRVVGIVTQDIAPGMIVVPIEQARAARKWTLQGVPIEDAFDVRFTDYTGLIVVASSLENVHTVRRAIDQAGFATGAPERLIASVDHYVKVIGIILGGVAAIALVIASLSLASAMLAASYERKVEIGILKAIGARDREIEQWFLIEAGFIGAVGGTLGTALGAAGARIVGAAIDDYLADQGLSGINVAIPVWVLALGTAGALVLSILAGVVPARKAARLSATEAVGSL